MAKVFLGIGGNLGSRISNINTAIDLISDKIGNIDKISSIYMSEAWGFEHSKYFTNAVISLNSELSPSDILFEAKRIEQLLKRIKTKNTYEGRTMDIDILFYDNLIINTLELSIPHKKLHERLFVLMPMSEIAPNFIHPELKENISSLLSKCCDKSKIRKLNYGS